MREARAAAQRGAPRQLRRPAAAVVAKRKAALEGAILEEEMMLCRLFDAEETLQVLETTLQDEWAAYADRVDDAESAAAEATQAEVVRAARRADEAAWEAAALEAEALRTAGMAAVVEAETVEEATEAEVVPREAELVEVPLEAAVVEEGTTAASEEEAMASAAAGVRPFLEALQGEAGRRSLGGIWRSAEEA